MVLGKSFGYELNQFLASRTCATPQKLIEEYCLFGEKTYTTSELLVMIKGELKRLKTLETLPKKSELVQDEYMTILFSLMMVYPDLFDHETVSEYTAIIPQRRSREFIQVILSFLSNHVKTEAPQLMAFCQMSNFETELLELNFLRRSKIAS